MLFRLTPRLPNPPPHPPPAPLLGAPQGAGTHCFLSDGFLS